MSREFLPWGFNRKGWNIDEYGNNDDDYGDEVEDDMNDLLEQFIMNGVIIYLLHKMNKGGQTTDSLLLTVYANRHYENND